MRSRFWIYWATLCLVSYILGKDLNWDLLNYHFYSPFALLHWRFDQDFLAASVQSYINPILDFPFFALARSGSPDWVVSFGVCGIHAVNFVILRRIVCTVLEADVEVTKGSVLWLESAVLLGFLAPLVLSQFGSSLVDLLWSIPCLAAVSLWLRTSLAHRGFFDAFLIGLLSGVAVGLKMTAVYFAVALFLTDVLMAAWRRSRRDPRVLCFHVLGGAVGVALSYGWWGWILWSHYGSPTFPFFNDIFIAPNFPSDPLVNDRFRPDGFLQAFSFPLDVLLADKRPYYEKSAPDVRFLFLFLLGALAILKVAIKCLTSWPRFERQLSPGGRILLFLFLYYLIWLNGSGNGRYAMPLLLLLGVALVWLCFQVFEKLRTRVYVLIGMILLQGGLVALGDDLRWHGRVAWQGKAVDVVEAENGSVLTMPHTFLSLGTQTYAVTAAFAHADSRFINLVGQKTAHPGGPQWRRIAPMLSEAGVGLRTLYGIPAGGDFNGTHAERVSRALLEQELLLSSYGLALDRSDCQVLAVRGGAPGGAWVHLPRQVDWAGMKAFVELEAEDAAVMSCRVLRVSAPPAVQDLPGGANARDAFGNYEQRCLGRVGAESVGMERVPYGYGKFYSNSDILVRWQIKDQSMLVWRYGRYLGRIAPGDAAWPTAILDSCPAPKL